MSGPRLLSHLGTLAAVLALAGSLAPASRAHAAEELENKDFRVIVTRLQLQPRQGAKPVIDIAPVPTPYELVQQKMPVRKTKSSKADGQMEEPVVAPEDTWPLELVVTSGSSEISVLIGSEAKKLPEGRAQFSLNLAKGRSMTRVTAVDTWGNISDFDLEVEIALQPVDGAERPSEPKAFLVLGPAVFSRNVTRTGSALVSPTDDAAFVTGLRAVYRHRLFKGFTDRLPGNFKLFGDASGTLGFTLSGDERAKGMPLWLDTRATLECYEYQGFRLEVGAGLTFFAPGLSNPSGGTPDSYLGVVVSTRIAYPLSPKVLVFGGLNFALPNSELTASDLLVSSPIETFLAASMPRGENGFWEVRLKYFGISTSGTIVQSGQFERRESFMGAEVLFGWKY